MPYGSLQFKGQGCKTDSTVIKATYSGTLSGFDFWEHERTAWVGIPDIKVQGSAAQLTLVDNGPYDDDEALGSLALEFAPGVRDGKDAAASLLLSADQARVKSGRGTTLRLRGHLPKAKIVYEVRQTGGAICRVVGKTLKAYGASNGNCIVRAIQYETLASKPLASNFATVGMYCRTPR